MRIPSIRQNKVGEEKEKKAGVREGEWLIAFNDDNFGRFFWIKSGYE